MKRLALLLIFYSFLLHGLCQNTDRFIGKYIVHGKYTVIEGAGSGYSDSIEKSIEIEKLSNDMLFFKYFSLDSVKAIAKSDSFIIFLQIFGSGEGISSFEGKGRLSNDTIFYQYIESGYNGVFEYDCVGVRCIGNLAGRIQSDISNIKCYPNPFFQTTNVEIVIPKNVVIASLKIYNISGNLEKSIIIPERGKCSQKIDATSLNTGIYYGKFIFDNKQKYLCKMIKL